MTLEYVVFHIPRRMQDLGYGEKEYYTKFKHFLLKPGEQVEIAAFNQLFFMVDDPPDIRVSSELGVFDLAADNINELTYEHQGQINITSQAAEIRHVRFIQVIFKTSKSCQAPEQHTTPQK